ncbi:MAG: glycosyltransferase family 4 protein [Leptolyngbya sp. SIO3F4]|nr:glycosyltransferase family 4 protein [Leptolyngbya sp. SIO3F4]
MKLLKSFLKQFSDDSATEVAAVAPDYSCQGATGQPTVVIFTEHLTATYYLSFHFVLEKLHQSEGTGFCTFSSSTLKQNLDADTVQGVSDFVERLLKIWQPDVVVFSRYGLPYGIELLKAFKQRKISTVYHIDDDLLNLPMALGADIQKRHGNPAVLNARRTLLRDTDLIYASTPFLSEQLGLQFPEQKRFCGMYAPYLTHLLTKTKRPADKPLTIGYMGSKGHREDLQSVLPALKKILMDHPQVRFETFGTIGLPEELKEFCDRTTTHKGTANYSQFLQKLYNLHWDIGLAPLQDSTFNRCKAPTKFVEYTSCDIPTIASDINVYNQFSADQDLSLADVDGWYITIKKLIETPQLRSNLITAAQVTCSKQYSLDVLKQQIQNVLALL